MEISHIASCLTQLARSGALRDEFQGACLQAADLLKKVRMIVLGKQLSDSRIASQLRAARGARRGITHQRMGAMGGSNSREHLSEVAGRSRPRSTDGDWVRRRCRGLVLAHQEGSA